MALQAQPHQGPGGPAEESEPPLDFLQVLENNIFEDPPPYDESGLRQPSFVLENNSSASPIPTFHLAPSPPQEASAVPNPN